MEFQGGIQFSVHVSWILPEEFEAIVDQGLRVVGTDGCAELDGQYLGARDCFKGESTNTPNHEFYLENRQSDGSILYSGYGIDSIEKFCDVVTLAKAGCSMKDLKGEYASGAEAVEVVRIAQAAHKSIRTGKPVDLR